MGLIMVMILPLSSFFFSSLSGSGTQWLSERDTIVHLGGSPPALLGTDYSPASWSRSGCSLSSSALVLGELLSPGRSDIPTAAWKHTHLLGGVASEHVSVQALLRTNWHVRWPQPGGLGSDCRLDLWRDLYGACRAHL